MNMIYIYISKAAHLHSVCCNREDQKTSSFVGHIFGMPVWYKTIKHGIIWVCMARFWPSWYRSPKSTYIYIYIWICKENERNLHRAFKGLGKGFPHLPAVSMVYILDTWHPAQPPVPGPTWPHGYFWGPQSGRIHPFFQAPTRWFLYIYITDIYVIALFASQQLVLLRAGAQSHK